MTTPDSRSLPVTVVIADYNGERFIDEALRSVKRQTSPPREVIVVDDGSTDQSADIAKAHGVTVISQPNMGISVARNSGILAASQPWIAFLDTDDWWEPEKLEMQWTAVTACPQLGAVFTNFIDFDSRGNLEAPLFWRISNYPLIKRTAIAPEIMVCDRDSLPQQFFKGNFIRPSTLLVRRDHLIAVGLFDASLSHCEDRDCWLRLFTVCQMGVVERPVVRCRVHASSWSRQHLKMLQGAAAVTKRIMESPDRYAPGAAEEYQRQLPSVYIWAGRVSEEEHHFRQARKFYRSAWQAGDGLRAFTLWALSYLPSPFRPTVEAALRFLRSALRRPRGPRNDP